LSPQKATGIKVSAIVHIHIHIIVYKTFTERNEEAWQNRNYDYEITNNINRQYASLYNL